MGWNLRTLAVLFLAFGLGLSSTAFAMGPKPHRSVYRDPSFQTNPFAPWENNVTESITCAPDGYGDLTPPGMQNFCDLAETVNNDPWVCDARVSSYRNDSRIDQMVALAERRAVQFKPGRGGKCYTAVRDYLSAVGLTSHFSGKCADEAAETLKKSENGSMKNLLEDPNYSKKICHPADYSKEKTFYGFSGRGHLRHDPAVANPSLQGMVCDPRKAPKGAVLVYQGGTGCRGYGLAEGGHVEIKGCQEENAEVPSATAALAINWKNWDKKKTSRDNGGGYGNCYFSDIKSDKPISELDHRYKLVGVMIPQ